MATAQFVSRKPMPFLASDSVTDKQPDVDALANYIKEQKLAVIDDLGGALSDTQLRLALEYLLSAAGLAELEKNRKAFDALLPQQLSSKPVEAIKQLLDARVTWLPGAPIQLQRLMVRIAANDKDIQTLEAYIKAEKMKVVDGQQKPLDETGRRAVFASLLSDVGLAALAQARKDFEGILSTRLSDDPVKAFEQLFKAWNDLLPGVPLVLGRLSAELRTDSMVFQALKTRFDSQNKDRIKMRDQLLGHTGEMNIYSVIQAKINLRMGDQKSIKIDGSERDASGKTSDYEVNLFAAATYGFTEEKWLKSGERRLLMGLDTYGRNRNLDSKDAVMTIRDFLEGATSVSPGKEVVTKISGPMKGSDLKSEYAWAKDNNPLANFSQALSDRSKVVSDKVNELTTILNDKSNQYNSTIEIMMRFLEKWFSMLSKILS